MDGVSFIKRDLYVLCCIEAISPDLQAALRENLTRICHGEDQASRDRAIFKYPATLTAFWDRYSSKPKNTRIGMLGELLAHVVILKLLPEFNVVSPFFNMEEKSIRKGFDLLLYESASDEVWITEVKSGEMGGAKSPCAATRSLLSKARDDLGLRLGEQEFNHWLNAINAAQKSIKATANYRESVLDILAMEGDRVAHNGATASDNNVVLVSALFCDVSNRVIERTISDFSEDLAEKALFNTVLVLSLHKGTLQKLEDFLKKEAGI
jgi:hypothetical protein